MRLLKILAGCIAALIAAIGLTFVAARFSDGPISMIPGGPLTSGELVPGYVSSWDAVRDVETIELQLAQEGTSRTTWILVHDHMAYIPASLGFPPGKTWHMRADKNGRAVVRILGKRYDVRLDRISDPEIEKSLGELVLEKYGGAPPSDAGVWFFNLTSMAPKTAANS